MLPWGHFAVAYLLYSPYSRRRYGRSPTPRAVLALLAGAVFADVVDKPLGWGLGLIPSRSLGHSLVFAIPLFVAVYAAAVRYDHVATATAFAVSHLAHLATDLRPRLLLGYPIRSRYLVWPIVTERQFSYRERVFEPPWVVELLVTPLTYRPVFLLFELVLFGLAVRRWTLDGRPGWAFVRKRVGTVG